MHETLPGTGAENRVYDGYLIKSRPSFRPESPELAERGVLTPHRASLGEAATAGRLDAHSLSAVMAGRSASPRSVNA